MKQSIFVAMILSIIGGILFALGMCMCLEPSMGTMTQGIILGAIGMVILLIMVFVWRRMTNKAPIRISGKTIASVLIGIAGAVLLGVGMCLVMVWSNMMLGIIIGIVGILVLAMLVPFTKGLQG